MPGSPVLSCAVLPSPPLPPMLPTHLHVEVEVEAAWPPAVDKHHALCAQGPGGGDKRIGVALRRATRLQAGQAAGAGRQAMVAAAVVAPVMEEHGASACSSGKELGRAGGRAGGRADGRAGSKGGSKGELLHCVLACASIQELYLTACRT